MHWFIYQGELEHRYCNSNVIRKNLIWIWWCSRTLWVVFKISRACVWRLKFSERLHNLVYLFLAVPTRVVSQCILILFISVTIPHNTSKALYSCRYPRWNGRFHPVAPTTFCFLFFDQLLALLFSFNKCDKYIFRRQFTFKLIDLILNCLSIAEWISANEWFIDLNCENLMFFELVSRISVFYPLVKL